jgi:tetratricopeptide (TPR) repeat protein
LQAMVYKIFIRGRSGTGSKPALKGDQNMDMCFDNQGGFVTRPYIANKCILVCVFLLASASCFASIKGEVKKGNALYNDEKYGEALKRYEKAWEKNPESDVINFNVADALYKRGDYQKAIEHFQKALLSQDDSLRQQALYNLGNAEYKYGISHKEEHPQRAVSLLREALRHYERSLEIDSRDEDARFNYEFVKKKLERLKEEIEKEPSQSEEASEENDDQDSSGKRQDEKDPAKDAHGPGQDEESYNRQQRLEDAEEPENEPGNTDYGRSQQAEDEGQAVSGEEAQEMSREQALMLLESYNQNEEPAELYRGKIPMRKLPDVIKDW